MQSQRDINQHIPVGIVAGQRSGRLERRNGDVFARRVAKGDVIKLHQARWTDQVDRASSIGNRLGGIKHLEDTIETDHRGHQIDPGIGETGQRLIHPCDESGQSNQVARAELVADYEMRSDAVNCGRSQRPNQSESHKEHPPVHGLLDSRVSDPFGPIGELLDLVVRPAEKFDQLGSGHIESLGHLRVHLGVNAHLFT